VSRWSGDSTDGAARAAVEPIAALVGVLAVGAGLAFYVVALDAATPTPVDRSADAALDVVERELTVGGIVRPSRRHDLEWQTPVTVEIETDRRTWRTGLGGAVPRPAGELDPREAVVATRPVSVAIRPGETVSGRLRVAVHR
jgi:hypothetical protein